MSEVASQPVAKKPCYQAWLACMYILNWVVVSVLTAAIFGYIWAVELNPPADDSGNKPEIQYFSTSGVAFVFICFLAIANMCGVCKSASGKENHPVPHWAICCTAFIAIGSALICPIMIYFYAMYDAHLSDAMAGLGGFGDLIDTIFLINLIICCTVFGLSSFSLMGLCSLHIRNWKDHVGNNDASIEADSSWIKGHQHIHILYVSIWIIFLGEYIAYCTLVGLTVQDITEAVDSIDNDGVESFFNTILKAVAEFLLPVLIIGCVWMFALLTVAFRQFCAMKQAIDTRQRIHIGAYATTAFLFMFTVVVLTESIAMIAFTDGQALTAERPGRFGTTYGIVTFVISIILTVLSFICLHSIKKYNAKVWNITQNDKQVTGVVASSDESRGQ